MGPKLAWLSAHTCHLSASKCETCLSPLPSSYSHPCSLFLCLAAWRMPTGSQTYTHSLTHSARLPAPTQACALRPSTAYSFQHYSYTHTLSLTSPTRTRTCFLPLLSQMSPLLTPKSRALDWLQSTRRKGWDSHITLKWEEAPDLTKRILCGFMYC